MTNWQRIKKERLFEAQKLLKRYQLLFNKKIENKTIPVLFLNINKKNQLFGRSPYNQPVYINQNQLNKKSILSKLVGRKLSVMISKSNQNSLEGYIED